MTLPAPMDAPPMSIRNPQPRLFKHQVSIIRRLDRVLPNSAWGWQTGRNKAMKSALQGVVDGDNAVYRW